MAEITKQLEHIIAVHPYRQNPLDKTSKPGGNLVNSHPRVTNADPENQGRPNLQFPQNVGGGKLKDARNTAFAFLSFFFAFCPKRFPLSNGPWFCSLSLCLCLCLSLYISTNTFPTSLHWFPFLLLRSLPLLHPSILVQKLSIKHTHISTLNLMRFIKGNGKGLYLLVFFISGIWVSTNRGCYGLGF
jgi:hypothetical protein